jgi:hypothetical protein
MELESDEHSLERLQALEEEVREAETRLGALQASQRAMSTEVAAARDPSQFDTDALVTDGTRTAGRLGGTAIRGFLAGVATGTGVAILGRFIFLLART